MDATELKRRIDAAHDFVLLDVLPHDAFEELRIPGARNACIYEMAFLDQVKEAVAGPDAEIVVYGSGGESRDAREAAARLRAAGYANVTEFRGGRLAWQEAGLPCEGTGAGAPWVPDPAAAADDGAYAVDPEKSWIDWTGRNIGNRHFGTLRVREGAVRVENGAVAGGTFTVDMKSLEVEDLEGEAAAMLVRHLESEDFFAVADHPTAVFEIGDVTRVPDALPGRPDHVVNGKLTLRGITDDVGFRARIAPHREGGLALQARFDLDRTRWGSLYGSGRFFARLGMHLVDDAISLDVHVRAR